jgi:uncharacterized membrane protein
MYCKKCGASLSDNDVYCPQCGTQVLSEELLQDLEKSVKNSGKFLFWVAIIIAIFNIVYSILTTNNTSAEFLVIYIPLLLVLATILYLPLILWGNKLRNDDFSNLNITLRRVRVAIVYIFLIILVSLLLTTSPGWLIITALIDLFRAKKRIKEVQSELGS